MSSVWLDKARTKVISMQDLETRILDSIAQQIMKTSGDGYQTWKEYERSKNGGARNSALQHIKNAVIVAIRETKKELASKAQR